MEESLCNERCKREGPIEPPAINTAVTAWHICYLLERASQDAWGTSYMSLAWEDLWTKGEKTLFMLEHEPLYPPFAAVTAWRHMSMCASHIAAVTSDS